MLGAELNWLAYCQPANVLESATDTFNELPNVPGYLAINSPYPNPPVLYSLSYTSEFSINNAPKDTVALPVAVIFCESTIVTVGTDVYPAPAFVIVILEIVRPTDATAAALLLIKLESPNTGVIITLGVVTYPDPPFVTIIESISASILAVALAVAPPRRLFLLIVTLGVNV